MRQPVAQHEHEGDGNSAGDGTGEDAAPPGTGAVLARDPDAPRRARRHVVGALRARGAPAAVTEAAELITSELVTNSVKYGRDRTVEVALTVREGTATIAVSDGAPYVPFAPAEPAGEDDESGRGLFLVEALAARWGHRCAGPKPSDGTTVWAVLRWRAP